MQAPKESIARAVSLSAAGQNAEAAALVADLVSRFPREARYRLYLGRLLLLSGALDAAGAAYLRVTKEPSAKASTRLRGWAGLGQVHATRGDFEKAQHCYEQALAVAEDGIARTLLGALALRRGRPRDAESHFRRVLEYEPENVDALYNLALCVEDESAAQALTLCRRVVQLDPTYVEAAELAADLAQRER